MATFKDAQGDKTPLVYFVDKNTGKKWKCCPCQKAWLEQLDRHLLHLRLLKVGVDVKQTIGGAKKSAGYHLYGGNIDLAQQSTEILRVMRNMGGAAFPRDHRDGMDPHSHTALKGCPHMGAGPRAQVRSLEGKRNGLVNNKADRGPRSGIKWPLRTWQEGIAWSKAQLVVPGQKPAPEIKPVPSGKVKAQHFRKPHKPLVIGREWVDIQGYVGSVLRRWFWTMNAKGTIEIETYLPGAHRGDGLGKVEIRAVRAAILSGKKVIEPIDPTAYDTRVVLANDGDVRIRFHYRGPWKWPLRKIKIQARYTGPGEYVLTGTQYIDFEHTAA